MSPPGRSRHRSWSSKQAERGFSLRPALGGVVRSVLFAAILVLAASTVVYFSQLDEGILRWVVNAGSFIVLGVSAFVTARNEGRHGLLYGVAIGAGYAVVTSIVGALMFPPFAGMLSFLKRLGFSVAAGACGGILGVNS